MSFPYALAHAAAVDRHYQRISSGERIRALKLNQETGEDQADLEARREAVARKLANDRMAEFTGSPEGVNALINDSLLFLERALKDGTLSDSANELVLQGIVLCWGAFEVLARDTFVTLLNLQPQLAETLLRDPVAKRRFELSKVSLETLATHEFDLSGKMGTILAQQQDLSDLHSIKAVYEALFPTDNNLRDTLTDIDLRVLSQRRNLVVHRRGIIDDLYIKAVDCEQEVGEKLRILPDELEKYIRCSASPASALLLAVVALQGSTNETNAGGTIRARGRAESGAPVSSTVRRPNS